MDDHVLIRDGLRTLLAADPQFAVVGEASDGQALLDQLPAVPTGVVLLDLNMPVLDGLATTHRLRAEYPHLRILLLSMITHEHTIGEALAAGTHGYVLKNADKHEIIAALQVRLVPKLENDKIWSSCSSGVRLSKHLARFVAYALITAPREMLRQADAR